MLAANKSITFSQIYGFTGEQAAATITMLKTAWQKDEKILVARYDHEESTTRRNRCHPGVQARIF